MELFYDLVFVVAVAILGVRLLEDTSWIGVASFAGYFIALWWLWVSFTFYADRYDTDDLVYRLLASVQMVAIAALAVSLTSGPAGSTMAFALASAAARLVLILMYDRARRHVSETRRLVTGYIRGFSLGAVIWFVSAFVPEPARFYLWALALGIEFATPYVMRKIQAKVPLDVSHLPERFGLFTILVLGETIAAVVAGLGHEGWRIGPTFTAMLGVVAGTGLWWMYFDNLTGHVVRRRADQKRAWRPTVWVFSHLPLAGAIAAVGVGLEHAVVEAGSGEPFHDSSRWLLLGSVVVAFAAMASILTASRDDEGRPTNPIIIWARIIGIGVALVMGMLAWLPAGVIAFLVAVLCAAEVAVDVVVKSMRNADERAQSDDDDQAWSGDDNRAVSGDDG